MSHRVLYRSLAVAVTTLAIALTSAHAQGVDVSTRIVYEPTGSLKAKPNPDASGVVVWLTPLAEDAARTLPHAHSGPFRLAQKDKRFIPHLLIVPTGASVDFPNLDPFFHNVFSLFNGKRFDLGLYEPGTSRSVRFDREGVSYIFCNIHPEMGAVVISLSTPLYAVSTAAGSIAIHGVPPGRYQLHLWSEDAALADGSAGKTVVQVGATPVTQPSIVLKKLPPPLQHKNKFGEDYPPKTGTAY